MVKGTLQQNYIVHRIHLMFHCQCIAFAFIAIQIDYIGKCIENWDKIELSNRTRCEARRSSLNKISSIALLFIMNNGSISSFGNWYKENWKFQNGILFHILSFSPVLILIVEWGAIFSPIGFNHGLCKQKLKAFRSN